METSSLRSFRPPVPRLGSCCPCRRQSRYKADLPPPTPSAVSFDLQSRGPGTSILFVRFPSLHIFPLCTPSPPPPPLPRLTHNPFPLARYTYAAHTGSGDHQVPPWAGKGEGGQRTVDDPGVDLASRAGSVRRGRRERGVLSVHQTARAERKKRRQGDGVGDSGFDNIV